MRSSLSPPRAWKGLVLLKPLDDPPENARVTLWRGRADLPEKRRFRPLTDGATCIDFGNLHGDRYRWSVAVRGGPVAEGTFRTWCTPTTDQPRQRQSVELDVCRDPGLGGHEGAAPVAFARGRRLQLHPRVAAVTGAVAR